MSFFEYLGEIVNDSASWLMGIIIGLLGKISYEIYMKRALSVFQWIAVIGLSVFCGYQMAIYCRAQGHYNESTWAVPMATLMGEKIFIYLMSNYKKIFTHIFSFFIPKK